jgi:hypothetical protein
MALGVRLGGQNGVWKTEHPGVAQEIGVKTCGEKSLDRGIKHVEATGKAA